MFISCQINRSFNWLCGFSTPHNSQFILKPIISSHTTFKRHVQEVGGTSPYTFFFSPATTKPFCQLQVNGGILWIPFGIKKKRSSYRKSQVALWEPRVLNCESLLIHWLKRVRTASTISSLLPYGRALLLRVTSSEKWRESSNVHIGKTRH